MNLRTALLFSLVFVSCALAAVAQEPLTLEGIARDTAEWIGTSPSDVAWSEDGRSIYFMWNPEANDDPDLYVVTREGGQPEKIPLDRRRFIPTNAGERNRSGSLKVYEAYGDIYVFTVATGEARQLTDTEAGERNPRFTYDQTAVTFERGQNLFLVPLDKGGARQLTNFKAGKDPDEELEGTKLQEYMKDQQTELFEYIRESERLEKERKAREKEGRGPRVDPYYLGDRRVSDLALSPDEKFVTFIEADGSSAEKGRVVDMPEYVTESGFVEMRSLTRGSDYRRVKAGEPVDSYRLGVMKTADGTIQWIDHGQKDRAVNFNAPVWSHDGSKAVAWAGSVDHKDAWLLLLDLGEGTSRGVVHEHDDAWVRGFRTGRFNPSDDLAYGFMPDNESVYFMSERDGFFHLYVSDLEGGEPKQLTRGPFEIAELNMSHDKTTWYFTSTEVHPGERQLYSMPVQGGERTRMTDESGWFGYTLSPDDKYLALTYGTATSPDDLFVMPNRPGASMKQLTVSTTEEFRRHPWRTSEIVTFDDGEGHTIYADLWKPEKPHPSRAAIIRVHGAGWAQGVYRRWSGMTPFYHYLLQEGYTVLNLDYRGSRGYGRDFRTGIYRHMGETEIESALAAVEYLVEHCNVDRKRIGLFGGSYGGFFTLMALFKYPGVFAAGAVRAPVTDWAHYNHGYTTRILNNPFDDTEAYERSSPIYWADGFQDHLLIQHGVEDDNVHFQDSVRLAQRLLELRKDNWEIMIYPIEAHSLNNEEYNRLDVLRRRVKLFNRVLK